MKKRISMIISALLLFSLLIIPVNAAETLSDVSISAVKQSGSRPDSNDKIGVTLSVKNFNDSAIRNVQISVETPSQSAVTVVGNAGPFSYSFDAGGIVNHSFEVFVPRNVSGGNFPMVMTMKYTDSNGTASTVYRNFSVTVDYDGESDISASSSLLSKITVDRVTQNVVNPGANGSTIQMTVNFLNRNNVNVNNIMVSMEPTSSSSFMLIDQYGPFPLSLAKTKTGSISLKLYVSPNVIGGRFPLRLKLSYVDELGIESTAYRDISVLIDRGLGMGGIAYGASETPCLVVSEIDTGGTHVTGGNDFNLKFKVENKSTSVSAKNVLVTVVSDQNVFLPANGISNQIYIDSLPAGGTQEVSILLRAGSNIPSDLYAVNITLDYADPLNNSYRALDIIGVSYMQEQRLYIEGFDTPETAKINTTIPLTISYKNLSAYDMINMRIVVSGNLQDKQKTISLNDLKSGNVGSAVCYITPTLEGKQNYNISVYYDVKNGEKYSVVAKDFTINVTSSSILPTSDADVVDDPGHSGTPSLQIIALIALAIVVVLGGGFAYYYFVMRKRFK